MAQEECERAHAVLAPFGDRALRLHELADLIVRRKS
jgi:geranylgeranyl diphosphate synthase type II